MTTETIQAEVLAPESIELEGVVTGYVDGVIEEIKTSVTGKVYGRLVPLGAKDSAAASIYGLPLGKGGVTVGTRARFYCENRGAKGNSFTYVGHDLIAQASIRAGAAKQELASKASAIADMAARAAAGGVPVATPGKPAAAKPGKPEVDLG